MATNAAFSLMSASGTQLVKACEPIFTLGLSLCWGLDYAKCGMFPSVTAIIIGVAITLSSDPSFKWSACLAALLSNLAFAVRNTVLKSTHIANPVQSFSGLSVIGTLVLSPFVLLLAAIKGVVVALSAMGWSLALSAVFHTTFNAASIMVLSMTTPVEHALLNIIKRTFVVIVTIFYFHLQFSSTIFVGLTVIAFGSYLYQLGKSNNYNQKYMTLFLLFASVSYYLAMPLKESSTHPHGVGESKYGTNTLVKDEVVHVSTVWMYNSKVPDALIMNLLSAVGSLPKSTGHIYCGTTDCVERVQALDAKKLDATFVVFNKLTKRLVPLKAWAASHVFNKLRALDQYQVHKQHAASLAVVWHQGGIFLSPGLLMGRGHKDLDLQAPAPWVADAGFPLDACHFRRRHPLLYVVADAFAHAYRQYSEDRVGRLQDLDYHSPIREVLDVQLQLNRLKSQSVKVDRNENEYLSLDHYSAFSFDRGMQTGDLHDVSLELTGAAAIQFFPFVDHFLDLSVGLQYPSFNTTIIFNARLTPGHMSQFPPPPNVKAVYVALRPEYSSSTSSTQSVLDGFLAALRTQNTRIGVQDQESLRFLTGGNVDTALVGSLTLALKNPWPEEPRMNEIIMVDLVERYVQLLPFRVKTKGLKINQRMHFLPDMTSLQHGYSEARERLRRYACAKRVITHDPDVALFCVGVGVPVVFLDTSLLSPFGSNRTGGLRGLFHTFDMETETPGQVQKRLAAFPFDDPPPNPNPQLRIQYQGNQWDILRNHRPFVDTATRCQLVNEQWLD